MSLVGFCPRDCHSGLLDTRMGDPNGPLRTYKVREAARSCQSNALKLTFSLKCEMRNMI